MQYIKPPPPAPKHIWVLIEGTPERVCDWEGRSDELDDDGLCYGCLEAARRWGWDRHMIAQAWSERKENHGRQDG